MITRWQGKVFVYGLACPHQNTALRWYDGKAVRVPEASFALHARRHLRQGQRPRDARPRSILGAKGRQQRRRQSRQAVPRGRRRSVVEDGVRDRLTNSLIPDSMSCQDCLNRRDFLAKSALAAAALVALTAAATARSGPSARVGQRRSPVTVTHRSPGARHGWHDRRHHERALVRTGATTFLGLSRICTHQGCDTDVRNNRFECPCHGSIFSQRRFRRARTGHREPANFAARETDRDFNATAGTVTVA